MNHDEPYGRCARQHNRSKTNISNIGMVFTHFKWGKSYILRHAMRLRALGSMRAERSGALIATVEGMADHNAQLGAGVRLVGNVFQREVTKRRDGCDHLFSAAQAGWNASPPPRTPPR
ncbi:hypothetical protein ACFTZB_08950, partial [Rhodococcus sp. NPDC057014]|uniref:hypothetical protein n=1 Tax=Rhodococcus sp. NPDC057014 TaxID=3346000 RepID=UPI00362FCFCA